MYFMCDGNSRVTVGEGRLTHAPVIISKQRIFALQENIRFCSRVTNTLIGVLVHLYLSQTNGAFDSSFVGVSSYMNCALVVQV